MFIMCDSVCLSYLWWLLINNSITIANRTNLWFSISMIGFEIKNLFIAAAWLMIGIFQWTDFGFCIPIEFVTYYLQWKKRIKVFLLYKLHFYVAFSAREKTVLQMKNGIFTFLSPPPRVYASFLAAIRDETLNSSFLVSILIWPPPGLCDVLLNDPIFDRTSRIFGGGALPTWILFIDTGKTKNVGKNRLFYWTERIVVF